MINLFMTRPRVAAIMLLTAAVGLAMYPLWLGRFYIASDMHDVFIPLEDFFRHEQRAGRLPTWNPDAAWGFPVMASAQIGFWYLPLLLLRLLPLSVYLPLILSGHLIFLAIGTYLFARQLKISEAGSLLAALSMTLSSFVFQHLSHLNLILNIAWLPWQFLVFQRLAHRPTNYRATQAMAAISLAAPFLAGHLHLSFLMAGISLLYYGVERRQHPWPALKKLVPVVMLAGALAAPQVLPTLELVRYSSRGSGGDFDLTRANQHSFPVYHLPTTLWPRFFGTDNTYWGKRLELEYGIFIGTLSLFSAGWALYRGERRFRFFAVAAIVGFLLALGDRSPFRLVGLEPTLWYFSAPARWLLWYTFAMSILAGAGLDILLVRPQIVRQTAHRLGLVLAAIVIAANGLIWNLPPHTPERATAALQAYGVLGSRPLAYYEEKFASLISSLQHHSLSLTSWYTWLPLLLLLLIPWFMKQRQAAAWLVGASALELILIAATSNSTVPWSVMMLPPASLNELPANVRQQQARLLSIPPAGDTGLWLSNPTSRPDPTERLRRRQLLMPLMHTQYGIAGVQWPASLDLQTHTRALANLTLAELNIGTVIADVRAEQQIESFSTKKEWAGFLIYDIPAEPRVALVSSDTVTPLPYQPATPTHLVWSVETAAPAHLIVRDTFYPGWQAMIDGQPAAIEPYASVFRQVAVPAGRHTITMTYQPWTLYAGLIIAASAIIITAGMLRPQRLLSHIF